MTDIYLYILYIRQLVTYDSECQKLLSILIILVHCKTESSLAAYIVCMSPFLC